ncbi:hypothetical protein EYF80_005137 [Liparis tanakae]|uniref:Uncharacterized protein n=1 Tax=Liparis tanakae TaxID=230148 RepID=A0A4Z2J5G0_9TELE|nr:hypothetical protein EYF80_005137 [Liparis tanakae]
MWVNYELQVSSKSNMRSRSVGQAEDGQDLFLHLPLLVRPQPPVDKPRDIVHHEKLYSERCDGDGPGDKVQRCPYLSVSLLLLLLLLPEPVSYLNECVLLKSKLQRVRLGTPTSMTAEFLSLQFPCRNSTGPRGAVMSFTFGKEPSAVLFEAAQPTRDSLRLLPSVPDPKTTAQQTLAVMPKGHGHRCYRTASNDKQEEAVVITEDGVTKLKNRNGVDFLALGHG